MADDKPRAPRARKKTETDTAAKPAAKKAAATTAAKEGDDRRAAGRRRDSRLPVVGAGAPGDATEHWLRAEQELVPA